MKKLQSNKGFTLVELIIVIAILAIIMLIAIPNFSGIQQRMKVRADKATAAQIGKAVRVWYTDYTSDPTLKNTLTDDNGKKFVGGNLFVDYTTLKEINTYCGVYEPSSLLENGVMADGQKYWVALSNNTNNALICVAIGKAAPSSIGTVEDYDGTKDGIAYVEPGASPSTSPSNP